jgi:protein TonB
VTKVLVLLDSKGNINRVQKLVGSGFNDLDDAAIEAFQKAAPYPNPPKGIVDADGFVRVRWDFILQTSSGPRIQFQPVR